MNRIAKRIAAAGMALVLAAGGAGCVPSERAGAALERFEAESLADTSETILAEATLPYLWLINEEYTLSAGYVPEGLLEVSPGISLAGTAAESWYDLIRGMKLADVEPDFDYLTGYVPYEEREKQVEEAAAYYLEEGYSRVRAEKFAMYDCGRPGADPFQTGMLLQIETDASGPAARWLRENAAEYGFLLTEEENVFTLRCVGEWHALAMQTLGVDLEGYLAYLDQCGSYSVLSAGHVYRVELLSDLSLSSGTVLAVCGDNRGSFIVITRSSGE